MWFDSSELTGQQNYKLLTGGVTPRPIAWISSRSSDGVDNLAPYSFFTVASCSPPVLLYTQIMPRTGEHKDTLTNLLQTQQCVVNIVNSQLLEQMNQTSSSLAAAECEFTDANIASCVSYKVAPLSVAEAKVRYECSLREVISVGDGAGSGAMVLLDVLAVYVDDQLWTGDSVSQALLDSVGKMGGNSYSLTQQQQQLERPA